MPPAETDTETTALFVRLPRAEARKLDRAAAALGAPKRELVRRLVATYVDPSHPAGLRALDDAGRRIVIEPGDEPLAVGRHDFRPVEAPEVLDPPQLAALLQVSEEEVLALADKGELPGRRIGGVWRFSRAAVLEWLGDRPANGSDAGAQG